LYLHESIVYQFHNIYIAVNSVRLFQLRTRLTLILHDPPILIPPKPPEALPVDEGMSIAPVAVGLMPDTAIEDDAIMSWFIDIVGAGYRAKCG
jgi:hypothetical protein